MDQYQDISGKITKLQSDLTKDLLAFGYVVGIILAIIGLTMLMIEISTIRKINQIKRWPILRRAGTIRDSYMETITGATTYSIVIVSEAYYNLNYRTSASFTYRINGKTYISNKISYYEPWQNNPIIAKVENDILTKGSTVDIRVNPNDPSEAYIFNKPYDSYFKLILAIILSVIGLYFVYKI